MDIKTTSYHPEWQTNRINWILEKYPAHLWKDKRVLELAPCNGVIGDFFRSIGADVLSVEGRASNIEQINKDFPELNVIEGNLDTADWSYGQFDVIINFGLFYHLENYHREHLENCINNCELLLFESVIFDSDRRTLHVKDEEGIDQSLSGKSGTPSTSYIESILRLNQCEFTKYCDGRLNSVNQKYDWEDKNSNIYNNGHRRMYIIERRIKNYSESPAEGVEGFLIYKPLENKHYFRVYDRENKERFIDYDICSEDLEIKIIDRFHSLYVGSRTKLDYSSKVLGKSIDS